MSRHMTDDEISKILTDDPETERELTAAEIVDAALGNTNG